MALACLALSALTSTVASAKEKRGPVLLLRVEAGDLSADFVKQVELAARRQLAESFRGAKLLPTPALDFDSMRVAASCPDDGPGCLASIGSTLGAAQVIRIVIARSGRDAKVTFHRASVREKKGRVTTVTIDDFNPDSGAIDELRAQLAIALGDARPPVATRVELVPPESDPTALEEIEVYVDDHKMPSSSVQNLLPGDHTLEVHRQGFKPCTRQITVGAGRKLTVPVAFEPLPPEITPPEEPMALRETAPVDLSPVVDSSPKPVEQSSLASPEVTSVQQEPKLLYTWILAGGAVVATGVGTVFGVQQQRLEGRLAKRVPFLDCRDESMKSAHECKKGAFTQDATWVAFPVAGVLGAAAVTAFFLEGGLDYFTGSEARPVPSVSGSVTPVVGGLAASITATY